MQRVTFILIAAAVLLVNLTARAQEPDNASQVERWLAQLQEERQQIGVQLEEAERIGNEQKMTELKDRVTLNELQVERHHLAGQWEEAKRTGDEQKVADLYERMKRASIQLREYNANLQPRRQRETDTGDEHPEIAAARRQVEHLRAAHKHLSEGGFRDLADMVGKRAEESQNAISRHEAQRREQSERDRPEAGRAERAEQLEMIVKELNGAIRQLREDVKQLREEVGGLRENAETKEKPDR